MEKRETQEFDIEDLGTVWETTVIYWEMGRGGTDEVSVTLHNDHVGTPQQRYTFRVTDESERECAFRKTDVDGESKPSRAALKALGKFGWSCTNFDLQQVNQELFKEVGPTLQYSENALGNVLGVEDHPFADYPFLLDVIETAQTAAALASTLAYAQDKLDDDHLEILFDEEGRDVLRTFIELECMSDPYHSLYLPKLAEVHFGMDISAEDIRTADEGPTPDMLQAFGFNVERGDTERRPPGFEGTRYAQWFHENVE